MKSTTKQWLWRIALGVAWLAFIASLVWAIGRGFDTHIVSSVWGKVIVGVGVVSWLGLTATIIEPFKKVILGCLAHRVGMSAAIALPFVLAVLLMRWSNERQSFALRCEPNGLTIWIDEERVADACKSPVWTRKKAEFVAYADGHDEQYGKLAELTKKNGAHHLKLTRRARWRCSANARDGNDVEPFPGCGNAQWETSRTWRLEIAPEADPKRHPLLRAEIRTDSVGIALRGPPEYSDCYSQADTAKEPARDQIDLDGCARYRSQGGIERYEIDLTVCGTSESSIAANTIETVKLTIDEGEGGQYEIACSSADDSGALASGPP